MTNSAFDVIGPKMVGPSSSHTAGAVRIGLLARAIAGDKPLTSALIELHGSFAATGAGHATDRGLVAGLLGLQPDDDRLKNALQLAETGGLAVEFRETDLGDALHPNSVRLTLHNQDGRKRVITGSSIGAGWVEIVEIDGYPTRFDGSLDLLLLWHQDVEGFLAKVTALLACVDTNIATIRTSRRRRAHEAITVIEIDSMLDADVLSVAGKISSVSEVCQVHRLPL